MRKLLFTVLLAASSLAVSAAPPSDESLKALLAATKAEEAFEAVYANLEAQSKQSIAQLLARDDLPPAQRKIL
jgi:hypothetical protein